MQRVTEEYESEEREFREGFRPEAGKTLPTTVLVMFWNDAFCCRYVSSFMFTWELMSYQHSHHEQVTDSLFHQAELEVNKYFH